METSLKQPRNASAIIGLALLIAGGLLDMFNMFDNGNALIMSAIGILSMVTLPLYIFTHKQLDKLRDIIIKVVEKSQRKKRRKLLS